MITLAADPLPQTEFQWIGAHLTPAEFLIFGGCFTVLFIIGHTTDSFTKIANGIRWCVRKIGQRRRNLITSAVEQKIAELGAPDYAEKIDKIDRLEERIDALEQRDDVASAWRIFDSLWHEEDEMERIEKGHPLKPRLTYRDFAAKYYAGERYINGVWIKLL